MNREETVALCRYVRACCPQQAIDEYTPDAWHDLLGDLLFEDCRHAARDVAKRQPFVAPAEIRAEVRRIRDERLDAAALPAPDPALADDPAAYQRQLGTILRQVGDGNMPFRAIGGGTPRGAEPSAEFKAARSTHDNDRVLAQTIACPVDWCPAMAGEPCRSAPDLPPMTGWHPSRLTGAREAEAS